MVLNFRRFVVLTAFFAAMSPSVRSQTVGPGPVLRAISLPDAEPTEPTEPDSGCVLLKNDQVLFGRARQVGEFVVVESNRGGEIRLDRQQVACWAPSIRALYQYRVDHRRDGDLAAHVRDAQWCLTHDLLDLAANELRAIYAVDPNHAQAKRIEQQLTRRVSNEPSPEPASTIAPVRFDSAEEAEPAKSIDGEPLSRFAAQIQPMLVNRCGNCHAHRMADQVDVQWRIYAPPTGTRASAEFTKSNLQATTPYIDINNPGNSPLLSYATLAHGGSDAPLSQRNAKAIDALRWWVETVAHALRVGHDTPNLPTPVIKVQPEPTVGAPSENLPADLPSMNESRDSEIPARLPVVEDPFDPDLFNRRFHIKTNGQAEK